MKEHDHAAHGVDIEPGSLAWSEWVKDYYRDEVAITGSEQ